jgi:glutaminase
VVNHQLGIGSYSPRLDAKGNSVRGGMTFKELGDELGLHVFDCSNVGSAFIRSMLE